MLAKTACTVIKIPLVNFLAIDIILSLRDLGNLFDVSVEFIAAKMLSIENKPTIVGTVIAFGVIAPFKMFSFHLLFIDINHNMVYYQRDKGKCYFSVTTTKTEAGSRIIPLLPEVKQALLDEKAYQIEAELVCREI